MLSTIYPPLSVLSYAPAALFHSPVRAIIAAEICSQVFTLLPVFLALFLSRRDASWGTFLLVSAAFVLWCNFSEVMRCIYLVHADAPALFLCAMCAIALHRFLQASRYTFLILASLCAALAPWAKQTAIPIVLCVPVVLLLTRQLRALWLYVALFCMFQVACCLGFGGAFGFQRMFFWIITVPSRHPWTSTWSTALDFANQALLRETIIPILIFTIAAMCAAGRFRPRAGMLAHAFRERISVIFGLVALLMWPTSVLGFVKIGGGQNTLLYSVYFAVSGAVLLVYENLSDLNTNALWRSMYTSLVIATIAVLCIPFGITFVKTVVNPRRVLASNTERVFEYCRKNPGRVYFPWHPLAVYLAEGRAYHFELGLEDRVAARMTIEPQEFAAHVPQGMLYVAYSGTPSREALRLLPEFNRRVDLPELPGWVVYGKGMAR